MTESPSWGLAYGLPLAIGTVVLLLLATAFFVWKEVRDDYGEWEYGMFALFSGGAALLVAVITAGAMYPYQHDYHHWIPTEGEVASVDSRMLRDGEGMTERFVVKFADGRIRSCDDTRCSDIEKGDHITLTCKREWQFTGTDGWACNWAGRE